MDSCNALINGYLNISTYIVHNWIVVLVLYVSVTARILLCDVPLGCWDVGKMTHTLLDTLALIGKNILGDPNLTHCRFFWDNFMTEFWPGGSAPEKGLSLEEWIIKSLHTPYAVSSLLRIYQVWLQNLILTTTEITLRCKISLQCLQHKHSWTSVELIFLFLGLVFSNTKTPFKSFHQKVTNPPLLFFCCNCSEK